MKKNIEGEQIKMLRSRFTVEELIALKKNAKAKNILIYALGLDEYNKVSGFTIYKQIWDSLVNAHEGTSQV